LVALSASPLAGLCKGGTEIIWPLSRNSPDKLILELPKGYGGPTLDKLDTSEMRATDLPLEEDLVITAMWPDLQPPATYQYTIQPSGASMETLVIARAIGSYQGQPINALETAVDNAVDLSVWLACNAAAQDSSGAITKGLCQTRRNADTKAPKFGLKRLGMDFNKYSDYSEQLRRGFPQRDIYYLRDGDGLKTIILCTAEEAVTVDDGSQSSPIAQCEHKFIDSRLNALVNVHYRRVYLEHWRDVEAAWRKLLDSFVER
jgi:hypothetical protein